MPSLFRCDDFGDATGWLLTRTGDDGKLPKQRTLIADSCQSLGIGRDGEQLVIRDVAPSDLADAIMRLAQAEARVAETARVMRGERGDSEGGARDSEGGGG